MGVRVISGVTKAHRSPARGAFYPSSFDRPTAKPTGERKSGNERYQVLKDKRMTNWWWAARRNGAKFRYCWSWMERRQPCCGMTRGKSPKRAPRVLGFEFYEWCCVRDGHRRQRSTTTMAGVFHTGDSNARSSRNPLQGFPQEAKARSSTNGSCGEHGGGGGPVSWSLSSRSRTKPLQVTECGIWTCR